MAGNRASIKYRFDQADPDTLLGGGIEIFIEDNGQPSAAESTDRAAFGAPMTQELFELSDPAACDDPNLVLALYRPVQHGNFVVNDD